jgi:hypothetical protein
MQMGHAEGVQHCQHLLTACQQPFELCEFTGQQSLTSEAPGESNLQRGKQESRQALWLAQQAVSSQASRVSRVKLQENPISSGRGGIQAGNSSGPMVKSSRQ